MLSEVAGVTDVFAHQERWIWDTKESSSRWDSLCKLPKLSDKTNKDKLISLDESFFEMSYKCHRMVVEILCKHGGPCNFFSLFTYLAHLNLNFHIYFLKSQNF